jgi:penicillin-binding protein 1A
VRLDEVSPHAIKALIATEDRRFYSHHGVDPLRVVMAALQTLQGNVQGGSTITQQLARNLFPEEIGRDRTINRKVKEMITALRIERLYGKQKILETYLNSVPFLHNVVGIEMAARTYFDKSAAELTRSRARP